MTDISERELLEKIVKAWESLPGGKHSGKVVETWLIDDMKPIIDEIRKKLKS